METTNLLKPGFLGFGPLLDRIKVPAIAIGNITFQSCIIFHSQYYVRIFQGPFPATQDAHLNFSLGKVVLKFWLESQFDSQ
jgi:hypothetical protein